MNTFKVGDIVRLKSGSPIMTIQKIYSSAAVQTIWFVDNQPYLYDFYVETLEVVENEEG